MNLSRIILFLLFFSATTLMAQESDTLFRRADAEERFYFSSGLEFIFSFARVEYFGNEDGSRLRFAPVFNFQSYFNYDASDYFGVFAGFAIRNVGFIYDIPDSNIKKKYRTYNFGIPVGIKLGRMNRSFLYGGYELEIPFHFKEKTFVDNNKQDKQSVWFSGRHPAIYHSVLIGVQLPYAANLKFKYYLTGFFNQSFRSTDASGQPVFPYENIQANVFYISLSFNILRNEQIRFEKDF